MIIVNGASANLSMIRMLMGKTGVFGSNSDSENPHRVSPSFLDPFTGENAHVVICPSHQVFVYMYTHIGYMHAIQKTYKVLY